MRILMASAYGYWGAWNPDDLKRGVRQVGGGETAMVNIARELAACNNEVIVFYDVDKSGSYDGVDYLPTSLYASMVCHLQHDVLVVWDAAHLFRFRDKAQRRVLAFQLNDASVGAMDWTIDNYFHPSRWHKDRFHNLYPEITGDKQYCRLTNGINYDRYLISPMPERNPYKVIYSSSPDRGLHHLLRIWPQVRACEPKAELHVYYDMDKWLAVVEQFEAVGRVVTTSDRGILIRNYRRDGVEGVVFHGGVGQKDLAAAQLSSAIMAYPCDPIAPTEGFSMSILEGIAAGCDTLITNADALPELWSNAPGITMLPLPFDDNLWVDTIVAKIRNGGARAPRVREDLSWKHVAMKWMKVLTDDGSDYA
jgi:glycosyltransferase involved in cell wall biosynthesis